MPLVTVEHILFSFGIHLGEEFVEMVSRSEFVEIDFVELFRHQHLVVTDQFEKR
jgi:hypothetical protein